MQQQPLQSQRGQAHRDQVDGYYPSGEEDEELDPGMTRYRAHDGPAQTNPQPPTAAQSETSTEGDKKPDKAKGEDKKPETVTEGEAAKKDKDTPPAEKKIGRCEEARGCREKAHGGCSKEDV